MKPIIKVEGLGKPYQLGAIQTPQQTLRGRFNDALRSPLKFLRGEGKSKGETLWALRDVNLCVEPGEVVGIIGRNGMGKSTLLKILSRITEPTTGRVELYGRVGSLLEVGTGFHPELTGRENVFLNAAIMGMRATDIKRKYDEIVAFAEVEKFMDTPVKRYSSGMYVRLAFAVAAYLEPEILIVDEVLAVGDAEFQKRCLGRMKDVTRHGRTVLFVSHNMAAIKSLCTRAVLLNAGRVACEGDVHQVVDQYLMAGNTTAQTGVIPDDAHNFGTMEAWFRRVELLDINDNPITYVYLGQPFRVALTIEAKQKLNGLVFSVGISSIDGVRVTSSHNTDGGQPPVDLSRGWHRILVDLSVTLLPRHYTLDVAVSHLGGAAIDMLSSTLQFEALSVAQTGIDHYQWGTVHGFVRLPSRWQFAENDAELPVSNAAA